MASLFNSKIAIMAPLFNSSICQQKVSNSQLSFWLIQGIKKDKIETDKKLIVKNGFISEETNRSA